MQKLLSCQEQLMLKMVSNVCLFNWSGNYYILIHIKAIQIIVVPHHQSFLICNFISYSCLRSLTFSRASTITKNWEFVQVCTICTSPYPYKNRPLYHKIVLNRTFVDAILGKVKFPFFFNTAPQNL